MGEPHPNSSEAARWEPQELNIAEVKWAKTVKFYPYKTKHFLNNRLLIYVVNRKQKDLWNYNLLLLKQLYGDFFNC